MSGSEGSLTPSGLSGSLGNDRAGWARPVTRRQAVVAVSLLILVWLIASLVVSWWAWAHWDSQVHLKQQPIGLSLPDQMPAAADVSTSIRSHVRAQPKVLVPINQTVAVRVPDRLSATSQVILDVPIDTVVSQEVAVPVQTVVKAEVPLLAWLPKFTVTVPISVTVPVKVSVPFKRQVRVVLPIRAEADLPDVLQVPLRAQLPITVPIDQPMQALVTRRTSFALRSGGEAFDVTLADAVLRMPLQRLTLKPAGQARP